MRSPRTTRKQEAYAKSVYPCTDVYVNKLGIRDQTTLDQVERDLSALRAEQAFPRSAHLPPTSPTVGSSHT